VWQQLELISIQHSYVDNILMALNSGTANHGLSMAYMEGKYEASCILRPRIKLRPPVPLVGHTLC